MDDLRSLILFSVICIFAVAGCDDSSNGSDPLHGILLGEHSEQAVQDLKAELDVDEPRGETNHIHIDGDNLGGLTDDEKALLQNSFNEGFIVSIYNMNQGRIQDFYRDVLMHSDVHAEPENVDIPDGQEYITFNVEQNNGVIWSSLRDSDVDLPLTTVTTSIEGEAPQSILRAHGMYFREWFEERDGRVERLSDGFISGNAKEKFEQLQNSKVSVSGVLPSLAKSWVQTNTLCAPLGLNVSCGNSFQVETQAWVVADGDPVNSIGALSGFLYVVQDLVLDNSAAITSNTSDVVGIYLSEASIINTFSVNGILNIFNADILENHPMPDDLGSFDTINFDLSRTSTDTQQYETADGGSVTGSNLSFEASASYQLLNMMFENNTQGTGEQLETSWVYTQEDPALEDCEVDTIPEGSGAITQIAPSQAFVIELLDNFFSQTLVINSSVLATYSRSTVMNPNDSDFFNDDDCTLMKENFPVPNNSVPKVFPLSIHIPEAPFN